MHHLILALGGYLLGCSNPAYYLSKLKKVDMRSKGSGNLGASNSTILFGWKTGILVALHDIGKAALSVLLARFFFPDSPLAGVLAGVSCVFGHIFPFYLKFRGGKGFASFWGMTLALNWRLALILALVVFLVTAITDYISLGTAATVISVPVYMAVTAAGLIPVLMVMAASVVILGKHLENYRRILKGEELGLRDAFRGNERIK